MPFTNSLKAQFEQVLTSNREEDAQAFLKTNPEIVLNCFGDRWAVNDCLPKLKFGNEYVSDFVVVCGQSGRFDVTLIELEPPTAKPFNANGSYAQRLNGALAQIHDWIGWINQNEQYFRQTLGRQMNNEYGRHQIAGSLGSGRNLSIRSKIVIGRRSMMSESDNLRRETFYEQHNGNLEIVPYDRLLDRLDGPNSEPESIPFR